MTKVFHISAENNLTLCAMTWRQFPRWLFNPLVEDIFVQVIPDVTENKSVANRKSVLLPRNRCDKLLTSRVGISTCIGIDSAVPLFYRVRMQHTRHLDAGRVALISICVPPTLLLTPDRILDLSPQRHAATHPRQENNCRWSVSLVAFLRGSCESSDCPKRDVRFKNNSVRCSCKQARKLRRSERKFPRYLTSG